MKFDQTKLLENIRLRNEYRKTRHYLWTNRINDGRELEKCNSIKREILKLESNTSKKFYRYKSFYDWDDKRLKAEIDCIVNNKITLITPSLFNDPYDCRPPIKLMQDFLKRKISDPIQEYKFKKEARKTMKEFSPSSSNKIADKIFDDHKEKVKTDPKYSEERIASIRKGIPIVCFASKSDDMYFWSHYAGSHKGFCIEYSFSDDLFDEFLHPVEYTESWPADFDKITDGPNVSSILIKSMDWVKELEWRMSAQYNQNCDQEVVTMPFPEGLKISAIYLGLDFFKSDNEQSRTRLLEAFEERKIFQMKLENDSYEMKPTQYKS